MCSSRNSLTRRAAAQDSQLGSVERNIERCPLIFTSWDKWSRQPCRAGTELVRLAAASLQLLGCGSILDPRLVPGHAAKSFFCSTGTICYRWARYSPSWAATRILQPRTLRMDQLIVGLAPFHDENCCFLGSISNVSPFDFTQESQQAFPWVDNRMFLRVHGNRAFVVVLNLLFTNGCCWQSSVVAAMVCASRQLYDCSLIMRMKNGLQVSFYLSFGKKLAH